MNLHAFSITPKSRVIEFGVIIDCQRAVPRPPTPYVCRNSPLPVGNAVARAAGPEGNNEPVDFQRTTEPRGGVSEDRKRRCYPIGPPFGNSKHLSQDHIGGGR